MYGAGLRLLRFCFFKVIIVYAVFLREQLFQVARQLAGNILNGDTLADVGGAVRVALRRVDELVQDLPGQRPHFHEFADSADKFLPLAFLFAAVDTFYSSAFGLTIILKNIDFRSV